MDLKPIKTKRDYRAALEQAERRRDAPAGSSEADAFDILTSLLAGYEAKNFPVADLDPIPFQENVMEPRHG